MKLSLIWTLARKELRDVLRNRWFLLYTVAFLVLSLGFSYLALAGAGMVGLAGFGRTAASLINLILLIVPLMALTIGAQSIAGEQEHKTLAFLLSQPVTRAEIFSGKYLGLALGLLASLTLGFGVAGLVMAFWGASGNAEAYVMLMVLAFLLGLVMLGLGFLVSASLDRVSVAVGIGIFLWLTFVFLGDLGLMGTAIVLRVPIESLFWLSLINPLQVFKMAAILNIESTLDVLGPVGIYGLQRYASMLSLLFGGALVLWIVLPATAAYIRFNVKSDL